MRNKITELEKVIEYQKRYWLRDIIQENGNDDIPLDTEEELAEFLNKVEDTDLSDLTFEWVYDLAYNNWIVKWMEDALSILKSMNLPSEN